MATRNAGDDLGQVLLSKIAPPLAKTIVSFISVEWLKKNKDLLELGMPLAWVINKILPNEGLGQEIGQISSDILATQIIEMADDKITDADNHPNPAERKFPDRRIAFEELTKTIQGLKTGEKGKDFLKAFGVKLESLEKILVAFKKRATKKNFSLRHLVKDIRHIIGTIWREIKDTMPKIKRAIYSLLWAIAIVILLLAMGINTKDTSLLGFVLAFLLIPFFILSTIAGLSKTLRPLERNLGLIFMFFTPIVVFLMGDIGLATSKIGFGVMGGYIVICLFFTAVGQFTGKKTNAPVYFLTFCFILTLFFVGYKTLAPANFNAHKLELQRWQQKDVASTNRRSFSVGVKSSVTYAVVSQKTSHYQLNGKEFTVRGTLAVGDSVALINHGSETVLWGEEQMVAVRQQKDGLFVGQRVWVAAKYLSNLQSPATPQNYSTNQSVSNTAIDEKSGSQSSASVSPNYTTSPQTVWQGKITVNGTPQPLPIIPRYPMHFRFNIPDTTTRLIWEYENGYGRTELTFNRCGSSGFSGANETGNTTNGHAFISTKNGAVADIELIITR